VGRGFIIDSRPDRYLNATSAPGIEANGFVLGLLGAVSDWLSLDAPMLVCVYNRLGCL
jgi:hypothetical protein